MRCAGDIGRGRSRHRHLRPPQKSPGRRSNFHRKKERPNAIVVALGR